MIPNPFSILGAKIFAGVAAAAIAFGLVQTVRIEGVFCRDVKPGEKPACIVRGFKQELASVRIDLEAVRRLREGERASHRQTKQNFRDAQGEAARLEALRLARVAADQKEINDARAQNYDRRIANARAAAEQLRRARGQAGSGAAGAAAGFAVPGLPDAPGAADGAAGDRRLSDDERLVATEQAIRLDELQRWVRQQHEVPTN